MKPVPKILLERHGELIQSEGVTVVSHIQRQVGEWVVQTLMIKDCDVPFQRFKSLLDHKVNLIYYPAKEVVGGFEIEIMQVVRVRRY